MMHGNKELLGIVTSIPNPPSTTDVWVLLASKESVVKGEPVAIKDSRKPETEYIGRVVDVINYSEILREGDASTILIRSHASPEDLFKGSISKPEYFKAYAKVALMYIIENEEIRVADTSPTEGSRVYKISAELLIKALGLKTEKDGACIGTLYSRPDVKVCLDIDRICWGHMVIFGQTWSGKSYAAGVLIEEIVGKGIPVIVMDHMGEYSSMAKGLNGGKGLNVRIYKPSIDLKIDPEDLVESPEMLSALGVTEAQFSLFKDAMDRARSEGKRGLDALKWLLGIERSSSKGSKGPLATSYKARKPPLYSIGRELGYSSSTVDGLRWKLWRLLKLGVLGSGYEVSEIIDLHTLTVIDVSETERSIAVIVLADLLKKLIKARRARRIPPVVVVVEEAHNYVPVDETPSSIMIRELIREARKRNIGVWLISQRPAGLHKDAVNIANTHIIFRLKGTDLEYVKTLASLTKEEVAEIPNLPDGVAFITGPAVRGGQGIKVRIRSRKTLHGGATRSFLEEIEEYKNNKIKTKSVVGGGG